MEIPTTPGGMPIWYLLAVLLYYFITRYTRYKKYTRGSRQEFCDRPPPISLSLLTVSVHGVFHNLLQLHSDAMVRSVDRAGGKGVVMPP